MIIHVKLTDIITYFIGGRERLQHQAKLSGKLRTKHLHKSKYLIWQHGTVRRTLTSESEDLAL